MKSNSDYVYITSDKSTIFWKRWNETTIVYTVIETRGLSIWKVGNKTKVNHLDDWIIPYCSLVRDKKEIKRLDKKRFLMGIY